MFPSVRSRVAARLQTYKPCQCRLYSSKPSSPADGANGDARAAGQALPAPASRSTRPSSKKNINAGKAAVVETSNSLPSVPSTHHIKSKDLAASAFFSLHRPLSVTTSFPKAVSDDAFAAIFAPHVQSNKTSSVISTLSNTVSKLELENNELSQSDIHYLDADPNEGSMKFPRHILSGRYEPFNVPPPPVPMNTHESLAAALEAAEEVGATQHRTYTAVLTIEESMDENGDVSYVARSSPLELEEREVEEHTPNRFLERMHDRQEKYEEYRNQRAEETGMWAISVKRQRKLKMKKHKYKKLMRRTRNLRRRLDRN